MKTIRNSVFETNSSSMHAFSISNTGNGGNDAFGGLGQLLMMQQMLGGGMGGFDGLNFADMLNLDFDSDDEDEEKEEAPKPKKKKAKKAVETTEEEAE